jgi:hypothetical protein
MARLFAAINISGYLGSLSKHESEDREHWETIAAPMSAAPFSGSISPVRAPTCAIVTTSGSVLEE